MVENNSSCRELLVGAIEAFYEAKKTNAAREKLYFKGLYEGMMQIIRQADLIDKEEINAIIDEVAGKFSGHQKKYGRYDLKNIDTPAYMRYGKDIGVER